ASRYIYPTASPCNGSSPAFSPESLAVTALCEWLEVRCSQDRLSLVTKGGGRAFQEAVGSCVWSGRRASICNPDRRIGAIMVRSGRPSHHDIVQVVLRHYRQVAIPH